MESPLMRSNAKKQAPSTKIKTQTSIKSHLADFKESLLKKCQDEISHAHQQKVSASIQVMSPRHNRDPVNKIKKLN